LRPVLSYLATLVSFGVAFSFLHLLIVWLNLSDLAALLIFALPVIAYTAYCTQGTRAGMLRSMTIIYISFAGVVLAAAGLVYLID
jgi:hypothetical protein